jgi:1,4-dihydroxy-2-naphthoate octaprenyltransferase
MSELARPVGLGLAARGEVADAVAWAHEARRLGLDSVWIHDSYFERDAVSYASAIASQVDGIRVALGAVNPFTRHPVLVAMTVSALDEMAPGRIICGLGSALPLRLAQMGIPYNPKQAVGRIEEAIDLLRTMWKGERLPSATDGLPPVQPMFAPLHHVPIFVAGYRSPMLDLAGRVGDGYLARPLESVPALELMLPRIRKASVDAGREADAVTTAGYLMTLVAPTRREALNRAKREPFVIYMMSILSDVSLERAGLEGELRDRIAEAWRAEDYHRAAELIPDELLDAFLLCGTVEEVAGKTWAYREAGLDIPVVQPVVQEEDQVDLLFQAALRYGTDTREPASVPAPVAVDDPDADLREEAEERFPAETAAAVAARRGELWPRLRRALGGWYEIARPFSFTASVVPVATGGALAAVDGAFSWALFLAALFAALFLHVATNVTNEIYDVRQGVDSITSPRASHAIIKGKVTERQARALVAGAFGLATGLGVWLILQRGWPVLALGVIGMAGGFFYTAPPLQYKYRALGLPLVFLLMGPLMVVGSYYVVSGRFDWKAVVASIPVGFLVAAILHGNEWRDISEDARAGISTLSTRFGRRAAHIGYVALVIGAYLALAMGVAFHALPTTSLLAMLSMPLLVRAIRASELGAGGQQRAIAMIDLETAQLHATFGALLVLGVALARVVG